MNVVLSCALGQVWWTDNHSCSNCDLLAYMSWMQGKLSCSCQSMNLLTETFGSSLIQNGLNFFFPSPLFPETVCCSLLFQFVLPGQGRLGGPWSGPWVCLPQPLLGMGVLYSAYSVSFNECVSLERSLPAGDQRVALPSRCDVPLHLQDENWMYTNVNGREPFMTVHA